MKHYSDYHERCRRYLAAFLTLTFCLSGSSALLAAQNVAAQTVTARFNNASLNEVIWEIQRQTDIPFIYNTQDTRGVRINATVSDEKVTDVLNKCLYESDLTYAVHNGVIAIRRNETLQKTEQQKHYTVKGRVVDEQGEGIPGANVVIKNTHHGNTTNIDGDFSINLPDDKPVTLTVSFIGYIPQDVKATPGKEVKVLLKADNTVLEEVVVTGYGNYKKSAYAGSASTIKTSEMKDVPAVSFSQVLQGAAPGIQMSAGSGQPGSTTNINIRGMGSFNASNSPLYVIDGVPVRSGSVNSMSSDAGLDIMSTINTSDIENITVIKDAAAASLYGSRAANGVIVITTKKGKTGKPSFNVRADWGYSDFAMKYRPVMSGAERREVIYEGLVADGMLNEEMSQEEAMQYADKEIDNYAPVPWCGFIDWDDVMFQKGNYQTYEISASGGSEQFRYYSSLAYLKQDGIALNSGLERITGRLNVDYNATRKLLLGANILFANVNQDVNGEGTSYTSPFYSSRNAVVPSDAVYNEDGSWNRDFIRNDDRNPRLSAEYDFQREYVTRTFNTIYAQYEFIKNLKFKSTLSYDYSIIKGKDWSDPRTSNGDDINGGMSKKFYEYSKFVWTNALTYNTTIRERHHLDALLGFETDETSRDYLSGYATNFATPDKNDISNGMKTESVGGSSVNSRLVSYLSRLNYDYENKYFLGGSYRIDGSSRLASSNRWGSFWSVSGAWRTIEEAFMSNVNEWLTDLKLRASYGVNGTLPSDYYGYMGLSSVTNGYLEQPGILQTQLENKDLSWETNYNFNIGLDFGFWNRLNFTIEYYTRTTKNLLMDRPVSMTTGFNTYLMNIGEVKNKGVELEIRSTNFAYEDFSWNTVFNLGHNRNKVVRLDGIQTELISGTQIRQIGKPYRTFYLLEFAGVNPENGNPQFYINNKDENGKYIKEITENPDEANFIPMKHADPVVAGGLSNTLRYKWFDLNFMFSYQFGGYSYDNWAQKTEHGGDDLKANIPTYYNNRWQKPGDVTNIERFVANKDIAMSAYRNSRRLHSSDFIRLKNLTFGVTAPKTWMRKAGLESLRIYMAANNLWTWARHDYYDPEAVYEGTAIWGTPPLKTVTFGLNLGF